MNIFNMQKQQNNNLKEATKQSLNNSLRIAYESQSVAKQTETLLQSQREQLQTMNNTLDETKQTLKRSERIVKSIKSIGSSIYNYFVKPDKQVQKQAIKKQSNNNNSQSIPNTHIINSKTNGIQSEEDDQLDQLTSMIKELKYSAISINKELCLQDKIIDDINAKTNDTTQTFKKLTKTINNIET
jgi:hypothetical protein